MRQDNDNTGKEFPIPGNEYAGANRRCDKGTALKAKKQPCKSAKGADQQFANDVDKPSNSDVAAVCARDMNNSIEGIASTINRLNEIAFSHALASETQSATVVAEIRRSIQEAVRGIQHVSGTLAELKSKMLRTGRGRDDIWDAAVSLDLQSSALQGAVAVLTGKIKHL